MNTQPKIALRGVSKAFGPKQVLNGVDLTIAKGESLVVIGGSGTGKSVLIKCIIGLLSPDSGSIQIDGKETTRMSRVQRQELMGKFGMLFQGGALFDSLTVWENIVFALLQNKRISKKDGRDLAVEKLAAVGLKPDVANLSPSELSGGMQKRVALARAIAANPEIIFFDEPTTGLDPIMADVINELIVKCTRELGSTAITITHDMASVRKIASRVAMIYRGSILWDGPASAIDQSGNAYVDQFVHGRAEGPITAESLTPNRALIAVTTPDLFMLDGEQLLEKAALHQPFYANASPFPHAVIDNFLPEDIALRAMAEFPAPGDPSFFKLENHQHRFQTGKLGIGQAHRLAHAPLFMQHLLLSLNAYPILYFLEALTGIKHLVSDPYFSGGGLHQILPGGTLGVHADFNYEPKLQMYRRINMLIYLNPDWDERWGGHLELWDNNMSRCIRKVAPLFNRCVIFNTSKDSYHGHPEPLACPEGVTRKSIAFYYYTREPAPGDEEPHKTLWQLRPGEAK